MDYSLYICSEKKNYINLDSQAKVKGDSTSIVFGHSQEITDIYIYIYIYIYKAYSVIKLNFTMGNWQSESLLTDALFQRKSIMMFQKPVCLILFTDYCTSNFFFIRKSVCFYSMVCIFFLFDFIVTNRVSPFVKIPYCKTCFSETSHIFQ